MLRSWLSLKLGVELAGAIEGEQIVGTADMLAVDEDLRHGIAPTRAAHHLVAPFRMLVEIDIRECYTLALQQTSRPRAIGTNHRGVDLDLRHASQPILQPIDAAKIVTRPPNRHRRSLRRRRAPLEQGSGRQCPRLPPAAEHGRIRVPWRRS